jgi:hypothetical protein
VSRWPGHAGGATIASERSETAEANAVAQFDEDTAYEYLVLTTLYSALQTVRGGETEARDDIRGAHKHFTRGLSASLGAGAVEAAIKPFSGLVLGAAYKVLDLTVEVVMVLNGVSRSGGRWTLAEKQALVRRKEAPSRFPIPLDSTPELWPRLAALYDRLLEPRHALVHRRVDVDGEGNLRPYNKSGRPLPPVSAAQVESFALAMGQLRESVVERDSGVRRINSLVWHLDALDELHGLGKVGAEQPQNVRTVEDNLEPAGEDRWRINVQRITDHLVSQGGPRFADLVLQGRREGGDVFYGARYEELPDTQNPIEFADSDLPPWLRRLQAAGAT